MAKTITMPDFLTDEEMAQLESGQLEPAQDSIPDFISDEEMMALEQSEPQKGLIQRGLEFAGKTIAGAVQHPIETAKGLGYGAAKSIAGMATDFAANVNPEDNEDINMTMPGRFPVREASGESSKDIIQRREGLAEQAVTPITENLTPQESRAAKIGELLVPASAAEIALNKPVGKIVEKSIKAGAKLLPKATTEAEKLDKIIDEGVSKGIKPTVVGKPSLARMEGFYDNAKQAVKTIAENRSDIKIIDDAGEVVAHPRTSAEFAQAIDQAKKKIYKQYHDMSVKAGDGGASFDLSTVKSELNKISSSDNLKMNPKVREYAASLADELEELDGAAPDVVEARIADLNNSLAGFYDGRVTKAQAQVDASVANLMRKELDDKITNAVGEGYQDLKNKYGSLKAIEKEVNKRALVNARQNAKGLTDLTDIFTGGEIVSGILSMNPALIAKGVAGRGIKEIYKNINKPDRYIERMFQRAYRDVPESVNQQMVTPAANVVSENLETPAYLRKGRAPLPEQPLETEWKKPVYKETPVSAKMMQLAEDFSKKKNPMSQIEGIDYMSRDAAGNLAQQVTEKKKLPITLEMQVGSIPTEAKREIVKYVSKHLEEKPEEIFKKGSGFIESIKGKIDVNKWFNDLTPEERDAFVKKIRGIKTEIKSDKLLTAKEISEKMFPSSAITQSELSNLRWQKDKSSLKDIRTK